MQPVELGRRAGSGFCSSVTVRIASTLRPHDGAGIDGQSQRDSERERRNRPPQPRLGVAHEVDRESKPIAPAI